MLQLDAQDFDFSKTATERISCDYNGTAMSIGFKGASFIEILSNFDCAEVIVKLADPSRAGLVLPLRTARESGCADVDDANASQRLISIST